MGGPFKKFQNNAPVPFPPFSSQHDLIFFPSPSIGGTSVVVAGVDFLGGTSAAPIDADVKVRRCHRAFDLGPTGNFGADSI
jgi:hypothetical protein